MHVQMNVSDKAAFFAAIARRLRPGARFAVFEVCRTGEPQPSPPLPWSLDGTDSFLATAAQLRATIESCGFEVEEWADETGWILKWFEDAATRMAAAGSRATLPAILADGPVRMMNFAGAIATGTLSIHRGSFTLAREST
jgi:hypothetical protein